VARVTQWRDPLPDARPGTFWGALDAADRAAVAAAGTVRPVDRGTLLNREGARPDQVWVLLSGEVEVFRDDPSGHRTVLVIHSAGEVLGELSAIDGRPMSASSVVTRAGSALVLAADRFAELCRRRPALAWIVTVQVAHRLRVSNDGRVRQRAEVRDRTVLALLDLAGAATGPVVLPVTQQRLADLVSAALISITRALDDLRELGAIRTNRGRIEIPDPGALRALLPPELQP
jgi:CRP/FNR family cyclic AMP-dependent transcriptional regulator